MANELDIGCHPAIMFRYVTGLRSMNGLAESDCIMFLLLIYRLICSDSPGESFNVYWALELGVVFAIHKHVTPKYEGEKE